MFIIQRRAQIGDDELFKGARVAGYNPREPKVLEHPVSEALFMEFIHNDFALSTLVVPGKRSSSCKSNAARERRRPE